MGAPTPVEFNHWESACDGGGVRELPTQHSDLGRPTSDLHSPTSSPHQRLCSSVEPSQGHSLTKELGGGTDPPNPGPQMRSSAHPGAWSAQARKLSPSATAAVWPLNDGLARTPRIHVSYQPCSWEDGWAELAASRAKPAALFGQGTWGKNQLESKSQKSISGLTAAFTAEPRKEN